MARATRSARDQALILPRDLTVDQQLAQMIGEKMGDVVSYADGKRLGISHDSHKGTKNAATYLVCRLLTDAVFNYDIRCIQLIINRIDGGLPKDTEVNSYQTQFSDCLAEIMQMTRDDQMKVTKDDTVMMAMCKSLYVLATQDIYWDAERQRARRRPPTDVKQERDAALKIITDRLGGRKTLTSCNVVHEEIEDADWIAALPSGNIE